MIAMTTNTAGSARSAPPALRASMHVARRFASALIFVLRQAVPVGFSVALAAPALAQPYAARQTGDVVELRDAKSETIVSVLPSVGNIVFEMTVKGQKVLRWPYSSIEDFKARPALSGIPFVGPWANRLDEPAFYANGKKYPFDMELGNVRGAIPIHGFLSTTSEWKIVEVKADAGSAWATSALEFYRQPAWMKQWPFAHRIEITYRVQNGALEVRTAITNMSAEPMPVAIGFHPYFQLTDSSRNEWKIAVGARTRWLLAPNKVPTGETEPIERLLPDPQAALLGAYNLDDVFSDLVRNPDGVATMSVAGKSQRLDVVVGPNFRSIVIWAPHPENTGRGSQNLGTITQAGAGQGGRGGQTQTAPDRNFICFEPMAGVTNAINLAHRGLYKDLQSIPPGATWRESFWVKPSGF
jgi:aldose 1-epimerase